MVVTRLCVPQPRGDHRSKLLSALPVWAQGVPLVGWQQRIRWSYRNFPGRLLTACLSLWVQLSPGLSSFFWFCVWGSICVCSGAEVCSVHFPDQKQNTGWFLYVWAFVISASSLDFPNCEGQGGSPFLNTRNALPWKSSIFIVLPHFVQISVSVNHFLLFVSQVPF